MSYFHFGKNKQNSLSSYCFENELTISFNSLPGEDWRAG